MPAMSKIFKKCLESIFSLAVTHATFEESSLVLCRENMNRSWGGLEAGILSTAGKAFSNKS